jgi:hypothetical protein
LAEQDPVVSEALITISGSVRNNGYVVGGAGCDEDGTALIQQIHDLLIAWFLSCTPPIF